LKTGGIIAVFFRWPQRVTAIGMPRATKKSVFGLALSLDEMPDMADLALRQCPTIDRPLGNCCQRCSPVRECIVMAACYSSAGRHRAGVAVFDEHPFLSGGSD